MLKKEIIKNLKDLGFDTAKLIEAIKSDEEVDFTMPTINSLSDDDLTSRDENIKKEAKKDGFKDGKAAGMEIANKVLAQKYGLTDVDLKDTDKVIAALDSKVATGDAGLKEQIKLLQDSNKKATDDLEAEKVNSKNLLFDADLINSFPANRRTDLNDKEMLMLLKGSLSFEDLDGQRVAKKDGQILRDPKTQNALPYKDAVNSWFTERKMVSEDAKGGRGGGDHANSLGGINSITKLVEKYEKENKNPASVEFEREVASLAKSNPDFVME